MPLGRLPILGREDRFNFAEFGPQTPATAEISQREQQHELEADREREEQRHRWKDLGLL